MVGSVACRSIPEVDWDGPALPHEALEPVGWAEADQPPDEVGIPSDSSWIPAEGFKTADEAVAACLSLHISTESELKGHKVEVYGVEKFKHDVKVKRRLVKRPWTAEEVRQMVENGYFKSGGWMLRGKRKKSMVKRGEPSSRSLLEFFHQLRNTDAEFKSLICLTYGTPFPQDGRICAKHQNAFHTAMTREYGPVDYGWCKEWQERGALHLHYATSLGEAELDHRWLADTWTRILGPWGSRKVWRVHAHEDQWQLLRSSDEAISRYFASYISNDPKKKQQKKVPKGFINPGRPWGVSTRVKPQPAKFIACNAYDIAQRMGVDAPKFYKQCADGKYRARTYAWGQSEKFE